MKRTMSRRGLLAGTGAVVSINIGTGLLSSASAETSTPRPRTRAVLLGTAGGPLPKPSRYQTSQVVIVDDHPYLIDCGDGVAYRLVQAGVKLRDLSTIFLTHLHSDHIGGYFPLLEEAWLSGMNGTLDVYASPPMQDMTRSWFDTIRYEMNIRIQDGFPPFEDHVHVHEIREAGVVFQDERVKVTSAVVHHPPIAPAFAFRFDGPDRSIVFSGDTNRSDAVIALAKDADVLVHEVEDMAMVAKFIGSMPGRNVEAGLKHHYETHTSSEDVGKIAAAANVKKLVLSHIGPTADDPNLPKVLLKERARTFPARSWWATTSWKSRARIHKYSSVIAARRTSASLRKQPNCCVAPNWRDVP
jgi:ribonuclease BN (tRNA processing enzyme)